ncbi:DUF385 domain-containing protein [Antrihabitans cavernicola]|uniref:DUF385 domain-containing protein n=2 Tax=Antrihabitans cavernicola TaxID=2495913 RepID=A0A5A7S8A3_9NOCA|nr:DUF385 domain-containing protein [Spelaeibacter cavernicola]
MALQGLANGVTRALMHVPLVSRGIGKRLVTLYVVGRKSGREYSVPVAYTKHDGALLIGTGFAWGRNLRTGEPIEIQLQGKRRTADVRVISDEAGVIEYYDLLCRDNRNFANFNNIGFTAQGDPDPEHMKKAFEAGARVFLLTPR